MWSMIIAAAILGSAAIVYHLFPESPRYRYNDLKCPSRFKDHPFLSILFVSLWGAIGVGLGAVTALLLGGIIAGTHNPALQCNSYRDTSLIALSTSEQTVGRYFIGAGIIDGELEYFYYTNTNGAIVGRSVGQWRGVVYEDATPTTAHITESDAFIANPWGYFTLSNGGGVCTVDFHVPEGSVNRGYTVGT